MRCRIHSQAVLLCGLFFWTSCTEEGTLVETPELSAHWMDTFQYDLPEGFTLPNIPTDNAMTFGRIALGQKLFFDPILSRDNSISCNSCHFAEAGMADTAAFSLGVGDSIGERNAPHLFNLAWQNSFMRDGGVPTLELQVLDPISDPLEMDFNIVDAAARMQSDSTYVKMSLACYGRAPDAFVITRALAAYQRQLVSVNSVYDQYKAGKLDLDKKTLAGMELFNGKAQCATCHSGMHFTDYSFRNNGLHQIYADTGRARITFRSADVGFFRVPSLRNLDMTAPYMHDGSLSTLESVIEHYNKGGAGHSLQDTVLHPLNLSPDEKANLIAFLRSLNDPSILERKDIYPPKENP